ncbi:amino acid ABC transporter permease [Anaerococcus sp. AGMB00486]|uniref:Amino acid ABC transporter permease n=2 Tax=Anaerococcus TaxID=165779 RepID=A0ABX2NB03_9FIRM|nr:MULTISPECIES: amino acid ABC transporter permease [Anaerococcus]MDY3005902.1 amino acid ABC transporter permease [Anaerococcus porci]MSS78033.1 amino acid ABC transporter permease [Anaerococcus porci]NVF11833.1 amino acid ABC transporter permease [Anaerococcus faecalis]
MIEAFHNSLIKDSNYNYLLDGLKTTLIVTIVSLFFSLIIGMLIAIVKDYDKNIDPKDKSFKAIFIKILARIFNIFVTIVRGTPSTIQLLIVFNVILVNAESLLLVAIVTFSINSAAYMSEVFRGGINSVDKGEIEAARSLGLSYDKTMKLVVIPQAFKNALPALGNEVITLFKETSISGFIGLVDLTRGAGIIISRTFSAAIPYFVAALIYLLIVLILEKIFNKIEENLAHA